MTAPDWIRGSLPRFLLVGGGIALIYSVLAAVATSWLPWPSALVSGALWVAFIPVGYWAQRRFTFADSRLHRHALVLYAATQVLGVAIVTATSAFLVQGLFWPDLSIHLAASALAALSSFAINRLVVFPDRSP